MKKISIALTLLIMLPSFGQGQQQKDYPADVISEDAIISALYDALSAPAGEARDWNRFRNLFAPEARLSKVEITKDG